MKKHLLRILCFMVFGAVFSAGIVPKANGLYAQSALNFDGTNDNVSIPHNAAFNITGAISVEAWIKTSATDERYIVTKGGTMIYMAINGNGTSAGKLGVYMDGATSAWTVSNTTVADGTWHHVAFTRNGTTLKLYVDGVLDKTATINATNITTNSNALTIGTRAGAKYFNGSMDEFRIWNRELPQCEIQHNRNCELGSGQTGLVAYYQFNQSSGTSLTDASGNNFTGTLTNFTLSGSTSNWVATGGVTTGTTCPSLNPSVSIAANPGSAINAGTSVTFTATPTNGGTTPTYQWKKNGTNVGTNSTTYTDAGLAHGDIISCVLTSNATCTTTTTATSNSITMSVTYAALNFDGTDDYVSCGNIAALNAASRFTFEAWVNTSSISNEPTIFSIGSNVLLYVDNLGRLVFRLSSASVFTSTTPFSTNNTWKHVAVIFDGTQSARFRVNIYVDAVSQTFTTSGTVPSTLGTTATDLFKLGALSNNTKILNGSMDEVRIWNRILSSCDIQNNKDCELGSGQTSLVANYQFNQSSGSSLTDASGNSNTGTLTNFALSGSTSNWIAPGAVTTGTTCTPIPTPSVNIAISTGNQTTCSNRSVTFTATSTNGGTTPQYTWVKNSSAVSSPNNTNPTYTNNTWTNNDVVYCRMYSTLTCTIVVSNSLTMTVNAPPTVSISNTGATACLGTAALSLNSTPAANQIQWYDGTTLANTATPTLATTGTTVAGGNGYTGGANGFFATNDVSVDVAGNIYISDGGIVARIQKWAPGATTGTTVAGGLTPGSAANQLGYPQGIHVDASGNIYIADLGYHRIQKWTSGATSGTTVAGGNGSGSAANQFDQPYGVYVDGAGNIYIADYNNSRIQKWAPGATTGTTVAGGNGSGSAGNQLSSPTYVYVDGSGNIYIADQGNHRIQKWSPGATTGTTVAGGNGSGSAANQLTNPTDIYVDGSGNIYIADAGNNRIQKWSSGATTGTTVAGGNGQGSAANQLYYPRSVYVDGAGNIYIADDGNVRIQKWSTVPTVTTYIPTTAGSYTAFVTDVNGCTATTGAFVVNAISTPSVSIAASPSGTITAGTSITFTATPTNGGTTPNYQWKKGSTNVGTNSATYTDATLANGDVITCVLTPSTEICASPTTATSSPITMSVTSACDCDPTCSPIPTAAGIYTATRAKVIGLYTHYCSGNNLLLSILTPTNGTVVPFTAVKIKVGALAATYYPANCEGTDAATSCFMDVVGGGVLINRFWHIDSVLVTGPTVATARPLQIVSYFTNAEYQALNGLLTTNSLTPLSSPNGLRLYQPNRGRNFGVFADPSTIKPYNAAREFTNTLTPPPLGTLGWYYRLPYTGIHSAEFLVPSLQNSGGIGGKF